MPQKVTVRFLPDRVFDRLTWVAFSLRRRTFEGMRKVNKRAAFNGENNLARRKKISGIGLAVCVRKNKRNISLDEMERG